MSRGWCRQPKAVGVALLGLALIASACGSSGKASGAGSTTNNPVRIAVAPFTNIDPNGDAGHQLRRLGIEETLTNADASGIGISMGMLASATQTSPLVWTLTLRPGIEFQDGTAVDAAAVVTCLQLDSKNAFSPDDVSTGTITVTGPLTFSITTKTPVGDIPAELANFEQYEIYDTVAYQAAGKDLASLVQRGIYTGPFIPVTLTTTGMTLTANRHYWGGKVALQGEKVLFIADPQAEVAAVQDGEADIAIQPPATAAQALKGDSRAYFLTTRYAYAGSWAMLDLMPGSILADPTVRRALFMAINYKALVAGLGSAGVAAADSIFPSYAPYAADNQVYDPSAANAALTSDGWLLGPGGIRTKDGKPLSFTYLWSDAENPINGPLGLVLQQQLKAVGFDMKIMQVEESFNVPTDPTQWGMTVVNIAMQGFGNPYTTLQAFLETGQGGNIGGIHDPSLDSLVARFGAATSTQSQDQLLRQIQGVVASNAYGLMLAYNTDQLVVSSAYRRLQPPGELRYITATLRPGS